FCSCLLLLCLLCCTLFPYTTLFRSEWLARIGYDPAYGARPLRRLVQREIGDNLAKKSLAGVVVDGDTVTVDAQGDGIVLGTKTPDRKSTRLNSSHVSISYSVFCLKR